MSSIDEWAGEWMKSIDLSLSIDQIIDQFFAHLHSGGGRSSISGGQSAANKALADLNVKGYAKQRSQVHPVSTRGATMLSPYIRHNLLTLSQLWKAVEGAPFADKEKYRDELLWQEYTRHLYARIGVRLFKNLRFEQEWQKSGDGWPQGMACVDSVVHELETQGWIVNQSRMWLASHWTVRNQLSWLQGQERMYTNLLDGSRAANLAGWQWTVGSVTGKPYGFARWQIESRAPGLCFKCSLKKNCPIQDFKELEELDEFELDPLLHSDPDVATTTGPIAPIKTASAQFVLLTVDSLGDADPALVANPDLPVVFVFNEATLANLQLSSKRIYFYLETLQDLAQRRDVKVYLGDPYLFAKENPVAVTYAPVPSFNKFSNLAEIHPFLWLRKPHASSIKSFSAWRGKLR
jgi:deoxyribodipyrimidine photo-lyase